MKIAFLGESTDDKRFLILCLARILQCHKKVVVYSAHHFSCEDMGEEYEYCGIDFKLYSEGTNLSELSDEEIILLDIEEFISIPEGFTMFLTCESLRRNFEDSIKLAGKYAWFEPSIQFSVIYLNVMEYCKVGTRYLDLYLERSMPSFTHIIKTYPIFFEEGNRVAMIESQFSDKLNLRALSAAFRKALLSIIEDVLLLDFRKARSLLKKAERMK